MNTHEPFTETGCYLDSHRGHYICRDVVMFAIDHGFIVGPFERYALDRYNHDNDVEDYPHDAIHDLCDEAIAWLNSSPTEREIPSQNMPPARPANTIWEFNDGDFGLYHMEDEE